MYTRQEIFDISAKHLLTQKNPAMDGNGVCFYSLPAGRKCAIGILIPPEVYSCEMEGFSIAGVYKNHPPIRKLFKEEDLHFLSVLQEIHDTGKNYREALLDFSLEFDLDNKVVKEPFGDRDADLVLFSSMKKRIMELENTVSHFEDLLNPRMWTKEMSDAWHNYIPDTQAAFDALREL